MNEKKFGKNEKTYFWLKPEGVIIHDGILDRELTKPHLCCYI